MERRRTSIYTYRSRAVPADLCRLMESSTIDRVNTPSSQRRGDKHSHSVHTQPTTPHAEHLLPQHKNSSSAGSTVLATDSGSANLERNLPDLIPHRIMARRKIHEDSSKKQKTVVEVHQKKRSTKELETERPLLHKSGNILLAPGDTKAKETVIRAGRKDLHLVQGLRPGERAKQLRIANIDALEKVVMGDTAILERPAHFSGHERRNSLEYITHSDDSTKLERTRSMEYGLDDDGFNTGVNMFTQEFHISRQNPLYDSEVDLTKHHVKTKTEYRKTAAPKIVTKTEKRKTTTTLNQAAETRSTKMSKVSGSSKQYKSHSEYVDELFAPLNDHDDITDTADLEEDSTDADVHVTEPGIPRMTGIVKHVNTTMEADLMNRSRSKGSGSLSNSSSVRKRGKIPDFQQYEKEYTARKKTTLHNHTPEHMGHTHGFIGYAHKYESHANNHVEPQIHDKETHVITTSGLAASDHHLGHAHLGHAQLGHAHLGHTHKYDGHASRHVDTGSAEMHERAAHVISEGELRGVDHHLRYAHELEDQQRKAYAAELHESAEARAEAEHHFRYHHGTETHHHHACPGDQPCSHASNNNQSAVNLRVTVHEHGDRRHHGNHDYQLGNSLDLHGNQEYHHEKSYGSHGNESFEERVSHRSKKHRDDGESRLRTRHHETRVRPAAEQAILTVKKTTTTTGNLQSGHEEHFMEYGDRRKRIEVQEPPEYDERRHKKHHKHHHETYQVPQHNQPHHSKYQTEEVTQVQRYHSNESIPEPPSRPAQHTNLVKEEIVRIEETAPSTSQYAHRHSNETRYHSEERRDERAERRERVDFRSTARKFGHEEHGTLSAPLRHAKGMDLQTTTGKILRAHDLDNRTVKQRFHVEHNQEEVAGEPHLCHADGTEASNIDLLTFDSVSENVKIEMRRNVARVEVKVNCERFRPIRGTYDRWMRKSVLITRTIDIDLEASHQGRQLFERVADEGNRGKVDRYTGYECDGGSTLRGKRAALMYSELMLMAEEEQQSEAEEAKNLVHRKPSVLLSMNAGTSRRLRDLSPRQRGRRLSDASSASDLLY